MHEKEGRGTQWRSSCYAKNQEDRAHTFTHAKTHAHTHTRTRTHTHTHTHARKVNKARLRRVEARVSERCCWGWPQHTNSSDSTYTHTHTHTHTKAMHTSNADCQRWARAIANVIIRRKCSQRQILFLQDFLPWSSNLRQVGICVCVCVCVCLCVCVWESTACHPV